MGRIRQGLGLVLALLASACGTGTVGGSAATTASQATTTTAQVAKAAPVAVPQGEQAVRPEVRTKYAWVRLRQDSFWIRPGDRTRLWLDISSSKPVRRYDADWTVFEGRLDRWYTNSTWEWNYWTAPEREGSFLLRVWVDIEYADGTRDREWVSEYLRVNQNRRPQ